MGLLRGRSYNIDAGRQWLYSEVSCKAFSIDLCGMMSTPHVCFGLMSKGVSAFCGEKQDSCLQFLAAGDPRCLVLVKFERLLLEADFAIQATH